MNSVILAAVIGTFLTAAVPEAGTQLAYRGTVARLNDDRTPGQAEKSFDLQLLWRDDQGESAQVYWTVNENGRGRWPWIERFGQFTVGADLRVAGGTPPALLYDRGEGTSTIVVPMPLLKVPAGAGEGTAWSQGELEYEVLSSAKVEDRAVWNVEVRNNYGRRAMLQVDQKSPLVLALQQRVFMGMGEEYVLAMQLVAQEKLETDALLTVAGSYEQMLQLRGKLGRSDRKEKATWNAEQLAALKEGLASVKIEQGPLVKVADAAQLDLETQSKRAAELGNLATGLIGKPMPKFELSGLSGAELSSADLEGQVTVLHFWEYRDTPLQEPYGQVGYLDFLHNRRKAAGVKVYGVTVDERLADESTRSAAVRSASKLRSFMNLGYPVLLDDAKLLNQVGDPRESGGELPVFVVIGKDGKIVEYKVGYYEVDRNEGLKQLDAIVGEALEAK